MPAQAPLPRLQPRAWSWLLLGTLVAGSFDLVFASAFWWLKASVALPRIGQSIAAGLLGPDSYRGGATTAALGFALHYAIMLAMVMAYAAAVPRSHRLQSSPWKFGAIYGVVLYIMMNYIVVPLSAAGPGPKDALWIGLSIAAHMAVGVMCAWFSQHALKPMG
jgi:hypothetical protein